MTKKKENLIKHYLLPYQSILKLTDNKNLNDDESLYPDPSSEESFVWGAMDGSCFYPNFLTKTIGNLAVTESFRKSNCGPDYDGSLVSYTVPANTYFGFTLAEANLLALQEVRTNGQANANANGTCTLSPLGWRVKSDTAYCVQDNPTVTQDIILRWNTGVTSFTVQIYKLVPGQSPELIQIFNKSDVPGSETEQKFTYGIGVNYGVAITMSVTPATDYANITTVNNPLMFATRGTVIVPKTSIQTQGVGEIIVMSRTAG